MAQNTNEAFSRVKIDAQLRDEGWDVLDTNAVRFEYVLPDRTKADYVLCDRNGRALAVIEAKKASINPAEAEAQAKGYAEQIQVPYIFLANGDEIRFWEWRREAFPRVVKTFFSQGDLERRAATAQVKRDPLTVPVDRRVVERDYQIDCIDALCREIGVGRRKLLVEMATGTGKTRTAAAFIKRLFEANAVTRVLFLVDRIPLARQTEDAFVEHLTDYPAYVLRAGRRFQDEKRITITTLQSMVNIYRDYSAGYFDLVISDECHRSIYGKWSGVLRHFDGIQVGLTATPCVANPEDFGDDEDKLFIRDTLRFFEVDRPTFSYKMKDAIRDGYLVPYQVYKAKTVKTAADGGFPVSRSELDWSAMDAETYAELQALFGSQDSIVIDPASLERKFTIPERNRAMVREFRDVLSNGYIDAQGVLRKPLIGKTIVFAVNKRHAETLANMFDQAFADQKPSSDVRFADYVVSGAGKDDTADGMTKIGRFKKEPFPQILVSVNMLDTGFDCPEVVNLIFARFTRSAILYQQMRGRGTRKAKGKPIFTMFDFVGVTDFHGDTEGAGEGGVVIERPRTPKGETRRLLSLDIDDHIDPTTREWVTVDENGNIVFPEASERRRAEIGARFEAWMLEREDVLTPDQQRWLLTIGSQLRANADAWDEFTTGHLAFPPFTLMGGVPEATRLFGGHINLDALLTSLNAAIYPPQDDDIDPAKAEQSTVSPQH
ncbi:DEAD/DEAH box helicase family protein [Burkholderia gladioli]|uniref:DEAD/DEAH box helicase family protein n=1 Tax=Burkholderia gladioli TaxID=28095 RepID=UPI00163DFDC8|nr:DEAD/DEAH box helicase family protein [Burkholderia gladioli]